MSHPIKYYSAIKLSTISKKYVSLGEIKNKPF
jgi:hypothetical protein